MNQTPANSDAVENLSYEEAREALIGIVQTLEVGGTTLAQSLELWERGEQLAQICEDALVGARQRLDEAIGD